MIYSAEKKFLFIHIPKTAGTSIRSVLEPYGGQPGLFNYIARRTEGLPDVNFKLGLAAKRTYDAHTTYRDIRKILPEAELDSLYKFAFVRNPFDRLYSFYLHILAHPEHTWYPKILGYGTFGNMLRHLDEVGEPTQKSYIIDDKGDIKTNFIGRLEQINTDFAAICEKLDIPFSLPKKNAREHKAWMEVFTKDDLSYAIDFYKEDFEAFGYDTDIVL